MLTQSIGRLWCLSILVLAAFSLGGMQSIVTSVQAAEAEPIVSVTDGQIRGRPLPGAGASSLVFLMRNSQSVICAGTSRCR